MKRLLFLFQYIMNPRSVGVEPHEAKFFMKNTPKISCQLGP